MLVPHATRQPLEFLRLDSPERILNVGYELYAERTTGEDGWNSSWDCIARGTLERTQFRDYQHENMTITWTPTRAIRYALVFADGTDTNATPLTITEAKGPDYRIVFPYKQGDEIVILAGRQNLPARAPVGYNPEQIRTLMRNVATPVTGTIEAMRKNPDYVAKSGAFLDTPLLLTVAIILAVLVLAFAVYKALQRLPPT